MVNGIQLSDLTARSSLNSEYVLRVVSSESRRRLGVGAVSAPALGPAMIPLPIGLLEADGIPVRVQLMQGRQAASQPQKQPFRGGSG
jgi:hypothetical protein